jgi:hypothetical protein
MKPIIFSAALLLGIYPVYAMNDGLDNQGFKQDLKSSFYPQLLEENEDYHESSEEEVFDLYEPDNVETSPPPLLEEIQKIKQDLFQHNLSLNKIIQEKKVKELPLSMITEVWETIHGYSNFLQKSVRPSKYILTQNDAETINLEIKELGDLLKRIESLKQEDQKGTALSSLQEIIQEQHYSIQELEKQLLNFIILEKKQQCKLYDYLQEQAGKDFNEKELFFLNIDTQIDQLQTTIEEIIEKTIFLLLDSQDDFEKLKKEPKEHFSNSIIKVIGLSLKYRKKYAPYIIKFYIERQLDYYINRSRNCNENIDASMEKWLKHSLKYADLMECFLLTSQTVIGEKASYILTTLKISEVATPKIQIFLKNGYDSIIKRYKNSRGTTTRLLYQFNITNSNTRKTFETFSESVTKSFKILCSTIDYKGYKEACEKELDSLDNEFKDNLYEGASSTINVVKNVSSSLVNIGSYFWNWGGNSEIKK